MKKSKLAVLAGLILVLGLIMMTGCNNNKATSEDAGAAKQATDQTVAPTENAPAAAPDKGMPAGAPTGVPPTGVPGEAPASAPAK